MTKKDRKMICPFHGIVDARPFEDKFACEKKDCPITRTEGELE